MKFIGNVFRLGCAATLGLLITLWILGYLANKGAEVRKAQNSAVTQPVPVAETVPQAPEPEAKKWYKGGTLHQLTLADWNQATDENKLATAGDFIANSWTKGSFNDEIQASINTVEDIKPYAERLVTEIDSTAGDGANDISVVQTAAAIMILMEWHGSEPPSEPEPQPEPEQDKECDPSYPEVCIPPYPPDLNCGDISQRRFTVVDPDSHGFDRDRDGVGCKS